MMKKNYKKITWIVLLAVLAGFSLPVIGWAELPTAASDSGTGTAMSAAGESPLPPVPSQAPGTEPTVKAERTLDGKYFLDFRAAPLINVLNVISSLSGINFVAGKEISDRQVNMTLDNVSLEDALQSIALGCNVSYEFLEGRNIYLFRASGDSPDLAPLMTRVFKFYYIRVSRLKEIELGAETGTASSSSGGSSISAGGGLTTLKQSDDEGKNIEGAAVYKTVEKMLSERGKVSIDDRSNSLVVTDIENRLKMIGEAISELDRPLDQVLINVLLVETFEDLTRSIGLTWGDNNGILGTVSGASQTTNWPFNSETGKSFWKNNYNLFRDTAQQFNPAKSTGAITAGARDFTDFTVTLQALEEANKVKVIAKPKVLVLDNHPALIKISTNAAIGTLTETSSAGGGAIGTSIERSEIGTILRVTPLINLRDQITMTVEPTFATVDTSAITVVAGAGGVTTGDPTTRQARTTLMVNDGQTIAIGGLLFSNQGHDDRKVPFFGNIPLIGKAFFTNNDKTIQDRELILFITPFIIRDPSVLETFTVPDKRLRFDDEKAPFWKMKQKQNFQDLTQDHEKAIDYDQYFDVRKRLMEATLDTLGQKKEK